MLTVYLAVSVVVLIYFVTAYIVDTQVSQVNINNPKCNSKEFSLQIVITMLLSLLWPLLFIFILISCFIPRKSYPHENTYQ